MRYEFIRTSQLKLHNWHTTEVSTGTLINIGLKYFQPLTDHVHTVLSHMIHY